jgi:hypothetical protein
MNNLFTFIAKMTQLVAVGVVTFSFPAVMVSIIALDLSLYKACVTSPAYVAFFGIISFVTIGYYTEWASDRSNKKS